MFTHFNQNFILGTYTIKKSEILLHMYLFIWLFHFSIIYYWTITMSKHNGNSLKALQAGEQAKYITAYRM